MTNDIFKYEIGQQLYVKVHVINDKSRMNWNGKEVDQFDLQECVIPITRILIEEAPGNRIIKYLCRYRLSVNAELVQFLEHELIPTAEAVAIIRMKQSKE